MEVAVNVDDNEKTDVDEIKETLFVVVDEVEVLDVVDDDVTEENEGLLVGGDELVNDDKLVVVVRDVEEKEVATKDEDEDSELLLVSGVDIHADEYALVDGDDIDSVTEVDGSELNEDDDDKVKDNIVDEKANADEDNTEDEVVGIVDLKIVAEVNEGFKDDDKANVDKEDTLDDENVELEIMDEVAGIDPRKPNVPLFNTFGCLDDEQGTDPSSEFPLITPMQVDDEDEPIRTAVVDISKI